MHKIVSFIVFVNIILLNLAFISNNYKSSREACTMANDIVEASNYIEDQTVVFPVNLSNNFLYAHISNYLGVSKAIIITDNYEASLNDFPIIWNCKTMPSFTFSGQSIGKLREDCLFNPHNTREIDYIVFINDASCNNNLLKKEQILQNLSNQYVLTYKNSTIQVYKLSNSML